LSLAPAAAISLTPFVLYLLLPPTDSFMIINGVFTEIIGPTTQYPYKTLIQHDTCPSYTCTVCSPTWLYRWLRRHLAPSDCCCYSAL